MIGTCTVTVTSFAPGAYVDGVWLEGTPTTRTITASVQPLSAREIERLPEGLRVKASLKLYTTDRLALGDEAQLGGKPYVVQGSAEFAEGALGHAKYFMVEKGDDE